MSAAINTKECVAAWAFAAVLAALEAERAGMVAADLSSGGSLLRIYLEGGDEALGMSAEEVAALRDGDEVARKAARQAAAARRNLQRALAEEDALLAGDADAGSPGKRVSATTQKVADRKSVV